jgi:hypothetical protein
MQDIGLDMEELFRRASTNYPLKQGEDMWTEIASKLNGKPAVPPANNKKAGHKKYYAVLLFLLGFLTLELFFQRPVANLKFSRQEITEHEMKQPVQNIKPGRALADKISKEAPVKNGLIVNNETFNSTQTRPLNKNIIQQGIKKLGVTKSEKIKNTQPVTQPINLTNDLDKKKDLDERITIVMKIDKAELIDKNHNYPVSNSYSSEGYSRVKQAIFSSSKKAEKKIAGNTPNHGFYYGLLAGPGLSSVENQGIKKAGFDVGLTGGFRFNNHLSLETGVLFSQKKYTTAGKFFSLKEIGSMMPAGMKVVEVKGSSEVVEIPVHLRYDLFSKKNHRFFSSAGFSYYIVTKESNEYHTSLNGTDYMMYGTYKNNKGLFAASLDLAIGYEKNIGKKNNIRFGPYIQLPLKGIGVGNVQVMSSGLHLAFTRSAH